MKANGKVFFVTGGASGLGEAVVRCFAALGSKTVIVDMDEGRGKAIAGELGPNAVFAKTDVTDGAGMQAAVDTAVKAFGHIDVLVTCAGIGSGTKVLGKKGPHPLDAFNKVIQINVVGTFNAVRLVVEQMANNRPNEEGERGVIIATSSVAAWEGQIGQAAYAASKGAINSMVLPVARELAPTGIRMVGIAPGTMATPALLALPENVLEGLAKTVPFPSRLGRPEEFAHLVNAIVENSMLNGTVIRQDGAIRMQAR
jgi:NAD(P)-dependent dehydrogenase (short-subunit alcohol dehydrogenase family)